MSPDRWDRFKKRQVWSPSIGLRIDLSHLDLDDAWLAAMGPRIASAFAEMSALEHGAIANADEQRRVGHYWLRDPARAPEPELRRAIEEMQLAIRRFAHGVHGGNVRGERDHFTQILLIGIGGSSLGPRFVAQALGGAADRMGIHFLDNTDPDGFDRVFDQLDGALDRTLTVVISKSGGTKETRNGMLEAAARYRAAGLSFGRHAVAVTGKDSELSRHARDEGFIAAFPMWDWVGGRTSELSAVGLLPAALQGFDVQALLDGARACDEATRPDPARANPLANPAMALALAWHHECAGSGSRDLVILPYKDRLSLLTPYLQQLVMESLGKERDRDGRLVNQGLTVYGNKGSTDQHAYVQQLRDGVDNFFVSFVSVLRDRPVATRPTRVALEVEPDTTAGDYLHGFFLGTREALAGNGRRSLTLTLDTIDARRVGALIALHERAVGYYASLINVNAYDQPGVEAGKRAASALLDVQRRALSVLRARPGQAYTIEELADALGDRELREPLFHLLTRLAENPDRGVRQTPSADPFAAAYFV